MAYRGIFTGIQNKDKYIGDATKVTFRSIWERNTFRWLDQNPKVLKWCSEEIAIPYICETDNMPHHYFPDLYVELDDGVKLLVEIKPAEQIVPPLPRKKTKKFIMEVMTFAKNKSKWLAASKFAADNDMEFVLWTENTLRGMGISITATLTEKKVVRAERKLLPNSKYNPKNRKKKIARPKRRS